MAGFSPCFSMGRFLLTCFNKLPTEKSVGNFLNQLQNPSWHEFPVEKPGRRLPKNRQAVATLIRYLPRESYPRPYAPKTNFSMTSATAPALLSAWQT